MESKERTAAMAALALPPRQVYALALLCVAAGIGIGYILRGADQAAPAAPKGTAPVPVSPHGSAATGHMPTLEELKRMADKQAAPLKEKLNGDPNNSALLAQVGGLYHAAHQYKDAADYYRRAAQADPKNPGLRTQLAASLYRGGDADGAIAELNQALKIDPKDANALFDLGIIRLEGKQDAKGARVAWQQLLKANPDLSPERKTVVEKLLAQLKAAAPKKGAEGHDAAK